MSNGKVPIISGLDESGVRPTQINKDVELFTPPATIGGDGTIKKIGHVGSTGEPPVGDLYPRMFAMPDGKVMIAGADPSAWAFTGITDSGFTWTDMPDLSRQRAWGSTVLVPGGVGGSSKLLALGGTDYSGTFASASSETFDEANPATGWKAAPSSVYGRGHANTVLLPDGSMVEVGGGVGSNNAVPDPLHYALPETRHVELWDKQTGDWTLGPAQSESRAYHSTALLLPDGRVMSAGDESNGDGVNVDTAEVYEPPYLHRGARPTIDSVSDQIQTGASFGVTTSNTNIAGASLVAPGAVTHGVDMNQRVIQLDVTRHTGCVSITAPAANVAPPGYYMLFLLNDQGVPSEAKFVKLQAAAGPVTCTTPLPPPDAEAPSVSVDTPANGASLTGSVKVKATASDNVGIVGVQFKYGDQNIGAEDTTSPYKVDWQTADVPNGTHELTAVARDAAGNTTPDSVTVSTSNADTTGPHVVLTSPVWGDTISGTTKLTATASDVNGVAQVQFRVDGNDIGPPDTTEPFSIDWLTSDVPNGGHALTAVATDELGHDSTSVPAAVTVHNDPPTDQDPPDEPGTPQPTPKPTPKPTPTPTPTPTDLTPVVSRLKLSHGRFRKGGTTTISFRLNEAAKVSLSVEAKLPGRKVRGRCVKPSKHAKPNCSRYVRMRGGLTFSGKLGTNRVTFRGKLGKRSLATGSYRLTLLAKDATGDWSTPVSASFKLLERASKRNQRAAQAAVLAWF
jgi:hypothetical protein